MSSADFVRTSHGTAVATNESVGGETYEGVGGALAKLKSCSVEVGVAPQYSYHEPVELETAQVDRVVEKIIPLNGMSAAPFEMVAEPMADYFLDLHTSQQVAIVQVFKGDGSPLKANSDNGYPPDNWQNALWKSVDTKINSVMIHPESSSLHSYRAQIEYLLSVEKSNCGSFRPGWYGMTQEERELEFKNNCHRTIELCGPIPLDVMRMQSHLAPGNKLSLTFHQQDAPFSFIGVGPDHRDLHVVVKDFYLLVNRIRLAPTVARNILGASPQTYLIPHTEIKDFPLAAGISSWSMKLGAGGILPHQVVVAFVKTSAFTGTWNEDPFEFQHFNLNSINLRVNGVRVPQDALTPDFANNRYMRAFLHVFQNTGKFRVNGGNGITAEDFATRNCLFPFDISPDMCNNFHHHEGQQGQIVLELGWAQALPHAITCIVLTLHNEVMQLMGEAVPPVLVQV